MTEKELQKSVIKDFWNWVQEHKDDVAVQFCNEKECWLYIGFDRDTLDSFTENWQGECEEYGCPAKIQMNDICVDMKEILGGYGFTMRTVWDARPVGIEDELGSNFL
jgi:hypothetical protein